jgi:hypothetical protein
MAVAPCLRRLRWPTVESHRKSEGPPGGTLAFSISPEGRQSREGGTTPAPIPTARRFQGAGAFSAGGDYFGRAGTIQPGKALP